MKFKPPGGELNWWSILWIVIGCFGFYLAIKDGLSTLSFFMMLLGLLAMGFWFQQKWCGWTLVVLGVLGIPLGLLAVVTADGTKDLLLKACRLAVSCYTTYLCYQWARKEEVVVLEAEEH